MTCLLAMMGGISELKAKNVQPTYAPCRLTPCGSEEMVAWLGLAASSVLSHLLALIDARYAAVQSSHNRLPYLSSS
ncbi:unnamed protein product [Sphenostylis stenocarpa]|uniref:Uncharacterized protein n=1 Tax=Sphenostylis stenocarpa TaxID=92480 RepID=A0AA86RKE8_9FABA|nr:unnamed protein product [Sphenostylis stenocarpa]